MQNILKNKLKKQIIKSQLVMTIVRIQENLPILQQAYLPKKELNPISLRN